MCFLMGSSQSQRSWCGCGPAIKTGGICDGSCATDESCNQVTAFLRSRPDFLERYLMEEVELEQLERWMIRKTQRTRKAMLQQQSGNTPSGKCVDGCNDPCAYGNSGNNAAAKGRKTSLSRWKFCVHADKRQMLQDLTQSLHFRPAKSQVLWELANCISSAVGADGFNLYVINPDLMQNQKQPENHLLLHPGPEAVVNDKLKRSNGKTKTGGSIVRFVAKSREAVRWTRNNNDPRFLDNPTDELEDISHILCQPMIQSDGHLAAVLELWRRGEQTGGAFHEEDEEISCSYLVWGGIALHYAQLYLGLQKQRKLNDFLLAVVKSIFQDMVSIDMLVKKVMNFAQRLVDADRASLFLVDNKSHELYAKIFDVGVEDENKYVHDDTHDGSSNPIISASFGNLFASQESDSPIDAKGSLTTQPSRTSTYPSQMQKKSENEIRFPLGTGIAGQVALTGEILNIPDAYADPRFNREVDQITGYKTESILCMPIFIRGSIIGVVQMVNKHTGTFNSEDEEAFEMFAVYCGLALHHAKLYDKIKRSEQKYRVALEVLSYHNTCTEDEFNKAIGRGIPEYVPDLDDYYFDPFKVDDYQKAINAMSMFIDIFGLNRFELNSLIRFTLTVKKNYRRVPYHNWTHGFSVANTMYCIIKHSRNVFRPNECLAMYIGALCHDLDHRGKNNKFMMEMESPLAAIYSTSTMEHHHFNQTVTILQQEGHNIFAKLTSGEYKYVLSHLKHCILATDLALFFPNRERLSMLLAEDNFSWNMPEHRMLVHALCMTGSDLSASAKPWDIQAETVKVIFEEFYQQGDAERAAGRQPMSMMDRELPEEQPGSQVGFLTGICIPCYSILARLIPETKPLLTQCQKNLNRWQELTEDAKAQKAEKFKNSDEK
ncbi:probable 3',5'-cyclic phosphodiesterase pde-5 isoform X2 [Ctenocephalides felis]|uniref:probable 3',5'-cyclic phosphodiesterase pde-5 isoform X2 n=1 Tax=Ctenocephalides felis TaxID=7515 RepID=UPI000E6E5A33|nr:probable 3',5'-cyclic phosphodiesterase pde-5 isoform X2 [Ctenocephalides felis]